MYDEIAGRVDKIIRTCVIPKCWAENPITDSAIATTPHANPFMNPATILLYSGKVFCAITIVTGWASIVVYPIIINVIKDMIG